MAPPSQVSLPPDAAEFVKYFVGERALPNKYIHITDANLRRTFIENPDPDVPKHGYALLKYGRWIDRTSLLSRANLSPEIERRERLLRAEDYHGERRHRRYQNCKFPLASSLPSPSPRHTNYFVACRIALVWGLN